MFICHMFCGCWMLGNLTEWQWVDFQDGICIMWCFSAARFFLSSVDGGPLKQELRFDQMILVEKQFLGSSNALNGKSWKYREDKKWSTDIEEQTMCNQLLLLLLLLLMMMIYDVGSWNINEIRCLPLWHKLWHPFVSNIKHLPNSSGSGTSSSLRRIQIQWILQLCQLKNPPVRRRSVKLTFSRPMFFFRRINILKSQV